MLHFQFLLIQKRKDEYKPAATSDGVEAKGRKGKKNKKDFDDLKKEVELVSRQRWSMLHKRLHLGKDSVAKRNSQAHEGWVHYRLSQGAVSYTY